MNDVQGPGEFPWGLSPARLHEVGAHLAVEGFFNPRIFHPLWFVREGLMSQAQCDKALEGDAEPVTHRVVSRWATDEFSLHVTADELRLSTSDQTQDARLAELLEGMLRRLPHTPATDLYASRHVHLAAGAEALQTADHEEVTASVKTGLGRLVSQSYLGGFDNANPTAVEFSAERSEGPGSVLWRVEPSYTYQDAYFFNVSETVNLASEDEPMEARDMAERIQGLWRSSLSSALSIFKGLDDQVGGA